LNTDFTTASWQVQSQFPLAAYTTFGVPARAAQSVVFSHEAQLPSLIEWVKAQGQPYLFLGGGSNVLFAADYPGIVLINRIQGIQVRSEGAQAVEVSVGGGENWHEFVRYCVTQGWGGVENLSLIPGTVGAAPVQNIGAYGVELQEVFLSLRGYDLQREAFRELSHEACAFGYRDSIFKNALKDQFIITEVRLRLAKQPQIQDHYAGLRQALEQRAKPPYTIRDVSDAVIAIRQSKLPDPSEVGNAGSFFKNPIVSRPQYEALRDANPGLKAFEVPEGMKLAAGWLIEQAGWRGYRDGAVGTWPQQALVLVNYGGATGQQVIDLARRIADSVYEQFGVRLARECNVIPPPPDF
jgi:UDP-N-acetylmuramate dehydrogenase